MALSKAEAKRVKHCIPGKPNLQKAVLLIAEHIDRRLAHAKDALTEEIGQAERRLTTRRETSKSLECQRAEEVAETLLDLLHAEGLITDLQLAQKAGNKAVAIATSAISGNRSPVVRGLLRVWGWGATKREEAHCEKTEETDQG